MAGHGRVVGLVVVQRRGGDPGQRLPSGPLSVNTTRSPASSPTAGRRAPARATGAVGGAAPALTIRVSRSPREAGVEHGAGACRPAAGPRRASHSPAWGAQPRCGHVGREGIRRPAPAWRTVKCRCGNSVSPDSPTRPIGWPAARPGRRPSPSGCPAPGGSTGSPSRRRGRSPRRCRTPGRRRRARPARGWRCRARRRAGAITRPGRGGQHVDAGALQRPCPAGGYRCRCASS